MRFLTAALCTAGLLVSVNSAQAIGCLSGAVAGGVAGHYAGHHGVIGAVAGCAYGHHLHKEQERKKAEEQKAKQNQPQ